MHPGEFVKEYLENKNWSVIDLSKATKIDAELLNEICNGQKSITENIATKLSLALERPAKFWVNLQKNYENSLK